MKSYKWITLLTASLSESYINNSLRPMYTSTIYKNGEVAKMNINIC